MSDTVCQVAIQGRECPLSDTCRHWRNSMEIEHWRSLDAERKGAYPNADFGSCPDYDKDGA